jgi:hypothetical protein
MRIDQGDVSLGRGNGERSYWDYAFLHLPIVRDKHQSPERVTA